MNEFEMNVLKAKKGDKEAFASLYAVVYEDMYHYALAVLRTREDAQDAVSIAVIDAFRNINRLRSAEKFRPWIFTILKNVTRRIMRKYYSAPVSMEQDLYTMEDTSVGMEATEERMLLIDALRTLNDDERQIIAMHIFAGYNSNEIAEAMGMNPATVRSKGSRALAKIKEKCHE